LEIPGTIVSEADTTREIATNRIYENIFAIRLVDTASFYQTLGRWLDDV
jgi:hypothetical protein